MELFHSIATHPNGDEEARTILIQSLLPLGLWLIPHYPQLPPDEVISICNLASVEVVDHLTHTFNPFKGKLSTYAITVMHHRLRKAMISQSHLSIDDITPPSIPPTAEQSTLYHEQYTQLKQSLTPLLSKRQLSVIMALYVDELSIAEVMTQFGLTHTQVINARHSAIKTLRLKLSPCIQFQSR